MAQYTTWKYQRKRKETVPLLKTDTESERLSYKEHYSLNMDLNKKPQLKPDFILEETDGEYSVIHPTVTTSLYLNDSGALIWELCDGARSIADIIALLTETYPTSADQIGRDVASVIFRLEESNIIDLID